MTDDLGKRLAGFLERRLPEVSSGAVASGARFGGEALEAWRDLESIYPYLTPVLKRNATGKYFAPDLFVGSRSVTFPELLVFGDRAVPWHGRFVSEDPIVASTDGRPAIDYTGWQTDLPGVAPISEFAKLFAESGEYGAAVTPAGYRVAIHRAPSSSGYYNDAPEIWDAIEPAIRAAREYRDGRHGRGST